MGAPGSVTKARLNEFFQVAPRRAASSAWTPVRAQHGDKVDVELEHRATTGP